MFNVRYFLVPAYHNLLTLDPRLDICVDFSVLLADIRFKMNIFTASFVC